MRGRVALTRRSSSSSVAWGSAHSDQFIRELTSRTEVLWKRLCAEEEDMVLDRV